MEVAMANGLIVPSPDTLPVHWMWFQGLLLLTFVLHLLLMNLMLGGSLIALWRRIQGQPVALTSKGLPTLIALTVNLGVPPLLFMQVLFGHLLYTSSVLMAVYWISVVPVLIVAYYLAYVFVHKGNSSLGTIALTISTLILLCIGFLLTSNMTFMLQPEAWAAYGDNPGGTLLYLGDPSIYPRYLHFVIGAVAVAGLGSAVYHAVRQYRNRTDYRPAIKSGLNIFAYATMVQIIIGLWFLMALPRPVMLLFMGGNMLYTVFLMLGITLTVITLVTALKQMVTATTVSLLATMVVMVFMRDFVRTGYLLDIMDVGKLPVVEQLSPLIAFLAVFALGLGVLYWMIVSLWNAEERGGAS